MTQTHWVSAEGFSVILRSGWCGHDGESVDMVGSFKEQVREKR